MLLGRRTFPRAMKYELTQHGKCKGKYTHLQAAELVQDGVVRFEPMRPGDYDTVRAVLLP